MGYLLLQILLLRQRRDKDELKCDSDTACVLIWHRVITTLTKSITNPPAPEAETEGMTPIMFSIKDVISYNLVQKCTKQSLINAQTKMIFYLPMEYWYRLPISSPEHDYK